MLAVDPPLPALLLTTAVLDALAGLGEARARSGTSCRQELTSCCCAWNREKQRGE